MKKPEISRRKFIETASTLAVGSVAFGLNNVYDESLYRKLKKNTVSIVRIKDGNISKAVEEAIDLLGGIKAVTKGRKRIMLKPNLTGDSPTFTTKPVVVKTLAQLMLKAGKEVMIGEGSAAASSFNLQDKEKRNT